MCFSATASFTAGAVLTGIGVVSIKKTKKTAEIPFASIPLLFALQQISEGLLWLALTNPEYAFMEDFSTHTFIAFAQVVWPFWVPFSIYAFINLKKNKLSIYVGKSLIIIGAVIACGLAYYLASYPVKAEIISHHISYKQDYPEKYFMIGGIFYAIVTIIPHFISSNKRMWILGISILLSFIFAKVYYTNFVVSVWCFFAAILSSIILWIVADKSRNQII